MEEQPSISVAVHPAEKINTRKTKAEAKIDVIPNWAERPVRNLLFYHPSKSLPLTREIKTRKTRTRGKRRPLLLPENIVFRHKSFFA